MTHPSVIGCLSHLLTRVRSCSTAILSTALVALAFKLGEGIICHPSQDLPQPRSVSEIGHFADVLGAWGSDVGGETVSEGSSSSGCESGEDIACAMQDGLSLQERYPVQSAQDVCGTWTPLQASGQQLNVHLLAVSACIAYCRKHRVRIGWSSFQPIVLADTGHCLRHVAVKAC